MQICLKLVLDSVQEEKKWDIGLGKIFKGCFDLVAGEIIIRRDFKLPFMNPKILIQIAMF